MTHFCDTSLSMSMTTKGMDEWSHENDSFYQLENAVEAHAYNLHEKSCAAQNTVCSKLVFDWQSKMPRGRK